MTTYQKLKLENAQLKRDLGYVVLQPDSREAQIIIASIKMGRDIEKCLYSSSVLTTPKTFQGFFHEQI